MSSGIGLPVIFPPSGSTSRRLAFLHRVPWVGSPASSVLLRRYDSLTPIPPRFVSFAWRYRDLTHRFAPVRGWDSCAHRPGLFSRSPKPLLLAHGDVRASQVPGCTPVCGCPARGPRTGPLRQAITAQECCRRLPETRRPNRFHVLSRLCHTAPTFAVYASRPALPQGSRKTRFRLVANLCRAGFSPAGFTPEGFHVSASSSVTFPPPPGLAWRDQDDEGPGDEGLTDERLIPPPSSRARAAPRESEGARRVVRRWARRMAEE